MLPRMLIVEDDEAIREIYVLKFELKGFEVVGAENGQQALEMLEAFEPDIILLDMMMPVMGGLEFMQKLRAIGHSAHVIVFSNISAPDQMQAIRELKVVAYWVKSDYTPELAVQKVQDFWLNWLGQREIEP